MRLTDNGKPTFTRSSRIFQRQNRWFFKTREGFDFGPFQSKKELELELEKVIRGRHAETKLRKALQDLERLKEVHLTQAEPRSKRPSLESNIESTEPSQYFGLMIAVLLLLSSADAIVNVLTP